MAAAAAARMMKMIRGVKASKMGGAGLMGDLKVMLFSTITPPPPPPPPIWRSESESESAVVRKGTELKKEKEKEKVWEDDPVALEELAAARRKRKRGGPTRVPDAANCKIMKEYAIFGLDQINQKQHTNLQLTRVLGAWSRLGPWIRYDITLEATDGGGKGKFYRVAVTDLRMFTGYKNLELLHWVLLDDPSPPIIPFDPGFISEYLTDLTARMESFYKSRYPDTYPDRDVSGWV